MIWGKITLKLKSNFFAPARMSLGNQSLVGQFAIIRVYHSVDLVEGCTSQIGDCNGQIIDLTMFKTIKISGAMYTKDIIGILAQKLKMGDTSNYCIYSIDSQFNKSTFQII